MKGRIFLNPLRASQYKVGKLAFDRTGIVEIKEVQGRLVTFRFIESDTTWQLPIKSKPLFVPVAYIPLFPPDRRWVAIKEEFYDEVKQYLPHTIGKYYVDCIGENGLPHPGEAIEIKISWLKT